MKSMAAAATANVLVPAAPVATAPLARNRRRRISPQAGHALEKLGHAIDYLTDEFVHEGGSFSAGDPQLAAVQLLMAANREIYFDCPLVPTFAQRWRTIRGRFASSRHAESAV